MACTPVGFKKVTAIKFGNRKLQEFAIPASGILSVKFSTRISRTDVEIRQQYNCRSGAYLEYGTS